MREATAGFKRDRLFSILLDADVKLPKMFRKHQAVDFSRWTQDQDDPIFGHVLHPLESSWGQDNQMALIRKLTISRPLRLLTANKEIAP